jgi:hypothetical protein
VILTVQLTNFIILGVANEGFGLKYKTGNMAAHIFRTEVKNEWSYPSAFSVFLNDMDRNSFSSTCYSIIFFVVLLEYDACFMAVIKSRN